ncbi:hypothetical protein QAD02_007485 [Eretmocerus hayati]|uniref:Uncharacterized protein n=1 Tax=Eretmocerus hayati TaxID=131215 RepID=A0ACC2N507_9HYME|nr:hypothetical protein QAD02_007485 [Eretmocerus hayati]
MARCQTRNEKRLEMNELPNLLLSTTYALNKSNTKSICIGLDGENGLYRRVIKFHSSGKPLTLTAADWQHLKDHFDAINNYFRNQQAFNDEFGKCNKIYLQNHDLTFATTYGTRTILIDERPTYQERKADDDHDSANKKMHVAPPSVAMQPATFDGLRLQSHLVDLHLAQLEEWSTKVESVVKAIVDYLKEKILREEEDAVLLLSDFAKYKQYYASHSADVEGHVCEKMSSEKDAGCFDSVCKYLVLSEILAFGLHGIVKKLRDIMINP